MFTLFLLCIALVAGDDLPQILEDAAAAKEDVYQNEHLSKVCHDDIKKKCGHLSQGNNVVRKCLQEHKFDADVSTPCKNEVLMDEIQRAKSFVNIDFATCTKDLNRLCPTTFAHGTAEDKVRCLIKNYYDMGESHIEDVECKEEIFGVLKEQAEDIRLAPIVRKECQKDIVEFCSDVQQGRGHVLSCLKDNLGKLSEGCFNLEFFEIAREASDIRLKPALLKACRAELQDPTLCKMATSGLMQLRCLQDSRSNVKMSQQCKTLLVQDMIVQSKSLMFRPSLLRICATTMSKLCPTSVMHAKGLDGKPVFADVEHCLMSKVSQIQDPMCKVEVTRIQVQMENDFRLDPEVNDACGLDARKFCLHVETGGGRVHACLQEHLKQLSKACRVSEFQIIAMAMGDMKLNPQLQRWCTKDIRALCADVQSKELFQCLKQHANDVKMDKMCKFAIKKELILTRMSWKLRPRLVLACSKDVERLGCAKTQDKDISLPRCKELIMEEMREEAEDIRLQPAQHEACRADEKRFCDGVSVDAPGAMHQCLRGRIHDLKPDCRAAVMSEMRKESKSILFKPVMRRSCRRDINLFCSNSQGRHQSVIACLQDNVDDVRMSPECKAAVSRDMLESSVDVRFSPAITAACERDREARVCFLQARTGKVDHMTLADGSMLRCLAEKREKLRGHCRTAVMRQLAIAAKDIRLDPSLHRACHDDQTAFCPQVEPGAGRVQACLRTHFEDLSADCKSEEFQREVEAESNIQLNVRLEKLCRIERKIFCADVDSDNSGAVIECLQENRKQSRMSTKCKAAIRKNMEIQSRNVMLNRSLLKACFGTFHKICNAPAGKLTDEESAKLITCMLNKRQQVRGKTCKMHLVKEMIKRSENFALDPAIHKNCASDVQFFCADVSHGNGQVHDCLRQNYQSLWAACRDAEFREQVRESQDARFMVGLLSSCRKEKDTFCAEEEPGAVLPCLQTHEEASPQKMSRKCINAIASIENMQMQHVELNHPLYSACRQIVDECNKLQEAHDAALRAANEKHEVESSTFFVVSCLVKHQSDVRDQACKDEIMREVRKWSFNAMLNPELAAACASDRKKFCWDVEPGEGRLNECLREHTKQLIPQCHKAVFEEQIRESSDVRFNVQVMRQCRKEIVAFCRSKPRAETLGCLQDNMHEEEFRAACQLVVMNNLKEAVAEPRLNFALFHVCEAEIQRLCSGEVTDDPEHAQIQDSTQCLIRKKEQILNKQCEQAVFRQQKLQAQNIELNAEERQACAADIKQFCGKVQSGRGRVHACLREHMDFLSPECRSSEFEEMESEHNDVRLNFPVAVACKTEIVKICSETSRAEVEFCLRRNKNHPLMNSGCRTEVEKDQRLALIDIRLQPMIHIHCIQAMKRLCGDVDVSFLDASEHEKHPDSRNSKQLLQCLIDHISDIRKQQCKQSVRTLIQNQVEDMSLIDGFSDNCRNDVMKFCESEKHSKFLFACLAEQRKVLSPLCQTSMRLVVNARNAAYNANPLEKGNAGDSFVLSGPLAVAAVISLVVVVAVMLLMTTMYLWKTFKRQKTVVIQRKIEP